MLTPSDEYVKVVEGTKYTHPGSPMMDSIIAYILDVELWMVTRFEIGSTVEKWWNKSEVQNQEKVQG